MARVVSTVIAAVIGAAIAYGFYCLSEWVGEGSPWWYVARYVMAHAVFSAWSNAFCGVFALDAAGGKKMRKLSR